MWFKSWISTRKDFHVLSVRTFIFLIRWSEKDLHLVEFQMCLYEFYKGLRLTVCNVNMFVCVCAICRSSWLHINSSSCCKMCTTAHDYPHKIKPTTNRRNKKIYIPRRRMQDFLEIYSSCWLRFLRFIWVFFVILFFCPSSVRKIVLSFCHNPLF